MLPSTNTETHVLISICTPKNAYPRFHDAILSTKYFDDETGLVYFGFRYYSPELGRFVSRDPIGARGGANLYGFLGNSPVGRWDLLGMVRGCAETGGVGSNPRKCCCRDLTYDSYTHCCCHATGFRERKVFCNAMKWRGQCQITTAGIGGGVTWIRCLLRSDLRYDCKMKQLLLKARVYGATLGVYPGALTYSAVEFTGACDSAGFQGGGVSYQSASAAALPGVGMSRLDIGRASTGWISGYLFGFDASIDAMYSWTPATIEYEYDVSCSDWTDPPPTLVSGGLAPP